MASGANKKLSLIIFGVDQVTGPLNKITARLNGINAPLGRMGKAFAGLRQAAGVDRVSAGFRNLATAVSGVGDAALTAGRRIGGIGLAAAGLGVLLKRQLIDPVEQLQRVSLALGAMEGSPAKAAAGMSFIKGMGTRSPFSVPEIANSFLLMRGQGMDPMHKTRGLQAIVDRVALMGGDSEGLQRAVLSISQMFGNNRIDSANMRELSTNRIPAWEILRSALQRKEGRSLSMASVRKAAESGTLGAGAINAFLEELGGGQAKGAAAMMNASTLGSLLESLSDQFLFFRQRVLGLDDAGKGISGGLFLKLQTGLQGLLTTLASSEGQQKLNAFADAMGDRLGKAFDYLLEHGPELWDQFTKGLNAVVGLANSVADLFGGWKNLALFSAAAYIGGPLLAAVGSLAIAFGTLAVAIGLTPAGWLLAAFAGLAAIAALVIAKWDVVGPFFKTLFDGIVGMATSVVEVLRGVFTLDFGRVAGGLKDFALNSLKVGGGVIQGIAGGSAWAGTAVADFLSKPKATSVAAPTGTPSVAEVFSRSFGATPLAAGAGGGSFGVGLNTSLSTQTIYDLAKALAAELRGQRVQVDVDVDVKGLAAGSVRTRTSDGGADRGQAMPHTRAR